MVEPINPDNQPKKYDFLLLGESGNGKTSMALTLTKDEKRFAPKSGWKSGSKEIIHGNSIDKNKKNQFTVIDTIGFGHEDFKSSLIEEKLLYYLRDHSQVDTITAVLYVIKISERNSIHKMTDTIRNIKLFDVRKNLVIVFTAIDSIYFDEDYPERVSEAFEVVDEILEGKQRNKIVLWINDKPQNKKHMNDIKSDPDLLKIYENQEEELLKAVSHCEPLTLKPLSEYIKLFKLEWKRIFLEFAKTEKNMKEQEISLFFKCNVKVTPEGNVKEADANYDAFSKVSNCFEHAKFSAGMVFAGATLLGMSGVETSGLLAVAISGASLAFFGGVVLGLSMISLPALGLSYLKSWYDKKEKINRENKKQSEKGKKLKKILFSSEDLKELLQELMKESGLENAPIVELQNYEKNKLVFGLNGETNNKIKQRFNTHFRIKQIEIASNKDYNSEFRFLINNEEDIAEIYWHPAIIKGFFKEKEEEDFKFQLNVLFKVLIDMPDGLILREKTCNKLNEIKGDLWDKALEKFPLNK